MKRLMLLSSALILAATMSNAAVTANDLVSAYQAQGYTRVEVKTGLTQTKVEAVKGKTKVEVIYDTATGEILKQESGRAGRGDRGIGVEISTEARDFMGGGRNSGGNDDDESNDDDSNDDNSNDDDSNDDDSNDNHGDDDGDSHGRGHGRSGHDD